MFKQIYPSDEQIKDAKEMTKEKMPDVIWASRRPQDVGDCWTGSYKSYNDQIKFYRYDIVEELLYSLRDRIEWSKKHDAEKPLTRCLFEIDKFLGEK